MRGRLLIGALLIAALAGCKQAGPVEEGAGIRADATHDPPPPRTVKEVPDGLFSGPSDAGGPQGEPGNPGVSGPADARRADARADARADSSLADASSGCDLLKQNCPRKADGCYPAGGGGACSEVLQPGVDGTSCFDHQHCDQGNACVRDDVAGPGFCRKLCNTATPTRDITCPRCVALPNTYPAGYCAP